MTSEQLSDDVTLYCGDCRDILPTLGLVDAVISDFPYGTEELVVGYGRTAIDVKHSATHIANDKNLDCVADVLSQLQTHQQNIWLAAFYSCRISPAFFEITKDLEYVGEMIWDKKMPGMGRGIRYQHENIAFFKIGHPKEELNDCFSVIQYARVADHHPHEKPVQLMHNIVGAVPGKTILDCFMGSGSTGVAAVQLKRKFIGIEIDQKHFNTARKRIEMAVKQPVNFWE
jgi:site-specific DNA-methyltransferase (adenine-specific)